MELTEEILCWVKADNTRTMLTIGWIIGNKLPNYFQKNQMFHLTKELCLDFNERRFPPFMLFATSFFFVRR